MELSKNIPLPSDFRKGYENPISGVMFSLFKIQQNMYTLQADIFNFQTRLKSDYGLYKFFISCRCYATMI